MVRLKKYIEWMRGGRLTNRIAYMMKEWDLPTPLHYRVPNGKSMRNLAQRMNY
jgi:hypothetical protein